MQEGRYLHLKYAIAGLEKTGTALVGYDGRRLIPLDGSDDSGIYYVVPKLARLLDWPLDRTLHVFFALAVGLAVVAALGGIFLIVRHWTARVYGVVSILAMAAMAYHSRDVYATLFCVTAGLIPLFLYVSRRSSPAVFAGFEFASGLTVVLANFVRSLAGVPVIIFQVIWIAWGLGLSRKTKAVLFLFLFLGAALPSLYISYVFERRDRFVAEHEPNPTVSLGRSHPVWHAAYLGLNYLSNGYVTATTDKDVFDKVLEIAPGTAFLSDQYSRVLKHEVLNVVRHHPYFVVRTEFAKAGDMFLLFLLFSNIGFLAALRAPKPKPLELAFFGAMAFHALYGFLLEPYYYYLLGFLTFAVLYAVVSVDYWMSRKDTGLQRITL